MTRLVVCLLAFLFVAPSYAEKRALTIADLYKLKGVGDPQFSRDGKRIAFTATEYFLEDGKSNSDIYLMNADGSGLRQMTRHEKADYHPRWSPDGRWLLFVSTRENGSQVWKMPVNGGEATQVTDFSMGVSDPRWLPDGKHIIFYTDVFPECGADDECNKKISDDMADGPVQAHLADDLLYRHWNFWKDGKRFHTFLYNMETEEYLDLTPGNMDAPSFLTGGGHAGFDVSPDGKELCVVANADPNEWETTNKDLWLVPITGGGLVNITDENEAYDAHPKYSPNGRYIAYIMQKVPTYEADLFRLAIYDRESGEKTVLTDDFDNWVDDFEWAPNSKDIYFTAHYQGTNPIYKLNIKSKKTKRIVDFRTINAFDLSHDGKRFVVSRRSIGEPTEIWACKSNGKSTKRLTTFNKPVEDEVDIRPVEAMWIDSPTGKKIHTWVVKPHGFDPSKKYPLILNVHGGPQGMWWDSFRGDWQVYPGCGYVVAFPNPHGSSGYGQEFTLAISRDWAGKVYEDVIAVADHMASLSWIDEDRMGAMGWSYGGYMMMWFAGHTDKFKCLVAMMGAYNLTSKWGATEELWFPHYDLGGAPWESEDYEKFSPHNFADNFKTPSLVITGEKDYRVPYTESLQFYTALRKKGVPARLIVFKNDGHWPNWVKSMPLYYNAHLDWFHQYLGGDPAPYDVKEMVRNGAFKDKEETKEE
ncbi:MAG: S9 family peptidase [Candidatus Latescibacterota bacterium]|nr:MAG: S9 family peptidase [Candidatus Latescibacterota bacterium]